ncbi:MAG: hypothetical protein EXS55_00950 [Candidatus Magasanikbacteria bacterium]|nr:hypothetical protein [Candidatus Magasanikbacteria bacterium]
MKKPKRTRVKKCTTFFNPWLKETLNRSAEDEVNQFLGVSAVMEFAQKIALMCCAGIKVNLGYDDFNDLMAAIGLSERVEITIELAKGEGVRAVVLAFSKAQNCIFQDEACYDLRSGEYRQHDRVLSREHSGLRRQAE